MSEALEEAQAEFDDVMLKMLVAVDAMHASYAKLTRRVALDTVRPSAPPSPSAPAAGSEPVRDKERAELVAEFRSRAAANATPLTDRLGSIYDVAADRFERDGQTIADLTRERDECDERLLSITKDWKDHSTKLRGTIAELREGVATLRSQIEAETVEKIVAWLRGNPVIPIEREYYVGNEKRGGIDNAVAHAIERGDWRTQPTGTEEG